MKKGYPHGDRRGAPLPMAPSHWPPLSSDENPDATSGQAQNAPTAGVGTAGHPEALVLHVEPTPTAQTGAESPSIDSQPKPDAHAQQPAPAPAAVPNTTASATPVATAWAVSNSAVKQPPPKRAPNPAPKKKQTTKTRDDTSTI